ncbi:pseudouridine synthase [[Clostridium] polysaccharolyticum]
MLRLDKYLADMGLGTRTEVKQFIKKGQVLVNEEIVKKPEYKVSAVEDEIVCCGKKVGYTEFEYIMLNKPQGVVSATQDERDKTVLDLITEHDRKDLFPVGRLDKDTEGLLLLTNDGKLAHELLSPKKHVPKTYFVIVDGVVTKEDVDLFAEGFQVDAELFSKPAQLKILEAKEQSEVYLTITEGKFHQVKRMFQSVNKPVLYLKRVQMGRLKLDETLKLGQYRQLTEEELALLR